MDISGCHSILIPPGDAPEWQNAVGLFVANAANLMKATKDALRASKLAQMIPNNYLTESHPPPKPRRAHGDCVAQTHSLDVEGGATSLSLSIATDTGTYISIMHVWDVHPGHCTCPTLLNQWCSQSITLREGFISGVLL